MTANLIGLDLEKSQALAQQLDQLLASYQVFYMNVRGYHWNIKGPNFFELHLKFEEHYTNLLTKVDEVAERILTLGHRPSHAYSQYLANGQIQEDTGVLDAKGTVAGLIKGYQQLVAQQRLIMALAQETGDEGTAALMSDYVREQEKHLWMLNAYQS